jgi:hypothetical protein
MADLCQGKFCDGKVSHRVRDLALESIQRAANVLGEVMLACARLEFPTRQSVNEVRKRVIHHDKQKLP